MVLNTSRYVQKILEMPPKIRRRLHLYKPRPSCAIQGVWNKESLIAWAKERNIRSSYQLRKQRKPGEPNESLFRKIFGSWTNFTQIAYGFKYEKKSYSAEYLVKCCLATGIKTKREWDARHKEMPDIVPKFDCVKYHFGRMSNLKIVTAMSSIKEMLRRYVEMWKQLGRWPTLGECVREKIDLSSLFQIHGSKPKLDAFLEELYEKRIRDSGQVQRTRR